MKGFLLTVIISFLCWPLLAQNVGIGTNTPAERLDVNGNMNISGTIKANGIPGSSGQVLTSTGSGLSWSNVQSEYKHFFSIVDTNTFYWIVPDTIKNIMIEAWGGGGGGNGGIGGGSGAYIRGWFDVNAGTTLKINVGNGGTGANTGNGTAGNGTGTIVYVGPVGNNNGLYAGGGWGASSYSQTLYDVYYNNNVALAYSLSTIPVNRNFIAMQGSLGEYTQYAFYPNGNSTYKDIHFGNGGNAPGWSSPTGGKGDYEIIDNSTTYALIVGRGYLGLQPGGGGGCRYYGGGYNGGKGMVIIWY